MIKKLLWLLGLTSRNDTIKAIRKLQEMYSKQIQKWAMQDFGRKPNINAVKESGKWAQDTFKIIYFDVESDHEIVVK